jgi:hypothetical protein
MTPSIKNKIKTGNYLYYINYNCKFNSSTHFFNLKRSKLLKELKADKVASKELECYINVKANFPPTKGIPIFENKSMLQKLIQNIGK